MKDIQPFIDIGFYTVPLRGELKRLEDGSKTTPGFDKNWRVKYQEEFNENTTEIGGTITGAISNIIAIDCDDQRTYDLFRHLDASNTFHFISKGKPKGGGTIIYKYPTGTTLESFSIQSELLHLDFYSDNGFVYLPTNANGTKEAWSYESFSELPTIHEIPETVLTLLLNLRLQYTLSKEGKKEDTPQQVLNVRANYLAPQLDLFVQQKKFIPSLFRIITPKDFRDLEQYKKFGYLHPENVPDGRGSEYLMKVSAIFGADPSVDKELYIKAIDVINSLWDEPISPKRLDQTITTPMIEGQSTIDGKSIWCYDEYWQTRGLAFTTKLGEAAEVFFDDIRASYYFINYTNDMIKVFYKEATLFEYIEPIAVNLPVRKELKMMCPVVRTATRPSVPFGFYDTDEYNREFNLFKQSPALAILNDPDSYKDLYTRPNTILQFLNTLIPDPVMRNFLLKFLRKKLTTFQYSPIVLYFLGTHGSGKDTFVSILENIIGTPYIAKPSAKEFIEQFNGWIMDKYFAQLDEYGNQLSTLTAKEEALGNIKAYTGKKTIQIRQMRTDGFNYKHAITFIMTQNTNPLMLEDGDRRVAIIETPNVLKDAEWVIQEGGTQAVIDKINKETNDFCYYLATKVNDISWDEYTTPPETTTKRDIIAEKLPAAQRIAYYLRHSMFEQFEEIVMESGYTAVLDFSSESKIYESDLFDLYTYMTEGRGTKRGLTKIMKDNDFDKAPTTKGGVKDYLYKIPTLYHYVPSSDFNDETIENNNVTVGGLNND